MAISACRKGAENTGSMGAYLVHPGLVGAHLYARLVIRSVSNNEIPGNLTRTTSLKAVVDARSASSARDSGINVVSSGELGV